MKAAQRLVAMILVLVLLIANGGITALAEAVLTMPAALQIIDEEAFYGSTSIDRVVLSNKVTEIRSKAFANSTLSEINLPASITYIADDAFDGPDKVSVTATEGTYAYRWAVEHGYISEEIEAIDFTVSPDMLTLTVGSTYTLNASFVPSNATTVSITWGSSKKTVATVNNGTITAKAEGTAIITAIAENGLTATCEVTVVRSIPAPTITSAEQDGMGTIVLTWNSLGNGYEYLVYESVDDALVLLGSTINNAYTTHAASAGVHKYCVQACILNDNDILVSSDESAAYDVDVQFIWSFGAAIEKIEQTSQDTASITWRGVSPVSYYEIAEVTGNNYTIVANNLTGDTTAISALTQGVHRFAIRSVYNDQNNITWTSGWSTIKAIEIAEASIISPSAPQLVFTDGAASFSSQEATATEFDPARFQLNWEHVENTNEYAVHLYSKDGNDWEIVLDDTTKDNSYALIESLFENVEDALTYRLDLASINVFEGEPRSYYFKIKKPIIDTGITINGSTSIIWNQANKNSSIRVFEINSELPWTVVENADWLSVSQNEQQLTVSVDEYDTDVVFAEVRTSTITVSNTIQQATITITQDDSSYAVIDTPVLSQDPSNPTIVGTSGIRFEHTDGGNDRIFILYKKTGNTYSEIYRQEQVKNNYTTISKNTVGFDLEDNAEYKVVLLAVYSQDTYKQYEVDEDILRSVYYFVAKADSSYVTVNGRSSYDLLIDDESSRSVRIAASGIYSWESDVDWISFNTSKVESTDSSGSLSIVATENYSASDRIGHVTVRSGSASATITVTQMSMLPQITFPAGLSENENSPTNLPYGYFRYEARCVAEKWFKYENNSYTEVEGLGGTSSSFTAFSDYLDTDNNIEAGAKYKIILTSGAYEKTYYVKFGSTEKTNRVKIDDNVKTVSWIIPSTAYARSITVQGEASWTATSSASWLKIAKTSGSTSKITTTITATANTTGADRTATITFKCGGINVNYISVTQKSNDYIDVYYGTYGDYPITEADTTHLSGKTKSYNIRIYAGANWSISSNVDWIGFDGSSFKKSSSSLSDMSPNTSIKIWLSENANGNSSRTGLVTVSSGNSSYSFTVSQEPNLSEPILNYPDLSEDYQNPSIYQYNDGDILLNWNAVQGASYYYVELTARVNSKLTHNKIRVDANGSSTYSATVPQKWLHPEAVDYHYIIIYAYDDYGHYERNQYDFYVQNGDAVYLNGNNEPAWNNATDLEVSNSYTVTSTTTWYAQPKANWITVTPASGVNGDILSVQLTRNMGTARTGIVTINCGNSSIDLIINQCAVIPEFPSLASPNYSTDRSNPTIIPANISSLTVTWINEPQASYYEIDLLEYSAKSAGHYVAESGLLRKGEEQYTFNNLSLTKGQLYWIEIKRKNNRMVTGSSYYFMIGDENSFVKLNGETSIAFEDDARGGGTCYRVSSSGVWTAISDSNWLTVGKKYIDEDYLINNGEDAEENLVHYGQSGDALYVYMFPNTTTSSRTGTVTVKSGTASATITFTQEKQYTVASLIEPAALAANPNEDIEISYGSLHLNWSASSSGTGNYEVLLYESDTGRGGYSRIYRKEGITSRSLTIPQSTFTEGKYYKLWLGSEIEDGDDYENGNYYYFTMGYQNGLAVSAIVDWSQVDHGGYVSINAFASGGAGGYEYAYQLLRNGEYEQQAEWGSLTYYQFKPWSNGNYQIRVLAKDSTGKQVSYTSNYTKNDENTISVATANHYAASLDSSYQFLDYSVLSQRSWSVTSYPDWITPSALTGTSSSGNIRLIVAKNDGITRIGKVEFKSDTGIISDLTITQTGSRSVAMVATEETFTHEAQTIEVSFAASDRWSASSDSSWATVSTKSGSSGNRTISVSLAENTGTAERTATVSVISNGDMGQYTIHQLGKTVEQSGLKLSATSWLVSSTAAESKTITITTNGNWSISSIPTWMSANVSSGFGNGDISLYCSGNTEQNARSGIVTISSGSLSQSINISQPGNDVIATVVGFTMSDSTVDAGTMVEFTVITKNADQVQLLVDDIAYNKYDVVDNQVTFTRAFSQGGTRKITIMPIRMGEDGLVSEAKYLTVNSNGTLDKPSFSIAPDNDYVGVAATITIPKVNNADIYTIRVYAPNSALIVDALQVSESELASNNRKIVIDSEKLLLEGVYSVNVIASGNGYSQSEDGNTFTRNARNYSISFSAPNDGAEYVPGDTIYATINQTGGGYASIKVVSPNGMETWYPISDNHTTSDASFTAYIPVEESGTYSIYGYVFAMDLPAAHNIVQKEAYITVKAKGPEISRINIAEYGKAYTWIYQNETNLYVTTNNSAEKITVIDPICNEQVSTSNYSLDGWNHLFIVQIPDTSAGAHSILVTATDEDTGGSCTASIDFYIASPVSNYTAYASADVTIVSSPINGSKVADILGGAYFEPVTVTHSAGDWLKIRDYLGNSGFVKSTILSQNVPANASGIITIVSPSANEVLPKGTNNTITIRWKSGIAINSQPNLTAVLKNLNTGTNYTLNSSTLFNSKFDVSSVPDGQYSVYLQMKNAAGTIVKSNTVEFILGGYSDEAYYREWFKTNIFPKYSSYLDTVGPYINGAGMNSIKEAYRFIVGGYVSNGDHWYYRILDDEQLSSWITLDETERKQVHLSLVSRLVMDDISRANNILKADLSNVSNVVATVQNNRVVKAKWDTITKAAETTWSGIQTATKAAALVSATSAGVAPEQASDFQDAVERWGERVIEMMKDLITETIEEYNSEALIEAYKQEYAKALKKACKEYVDYLEQTLFGSVGGSQNVNSNQLNERQKAALTYIQGYKRYMNNPVELQNDAVIALLEYCDPNLTIEQLKRDGYTLDEAIKAKFKDPDTYGMLLEHMIDYFVEDLAQYIFERIKPGMAVKEFTGLVRGWVAKAFKWDKTNHAFSVDLDGAKNQIIADAKKYMFTLTFDSFLNMLCQINVDNIACNQQMINQVLHNGSFSGEIDEHYKEVKTGIAKAAFSLCKSAWKTGNKIAGLIGAAYSWDSESQGRGAFEMYSVYLADAYKYHLTYTSGAMALPYGWNYLSNQSISRLEQLRSALIILMNNDVDALTYYRAMRTINENAGWRYHLILRDGNGNETDRYDRSDYASLGLIDAQIDAFNEIKQKVMDVPADIQRIIDKY